MNAHEHGLLETAPRLVLSLKGVWGFWLSSFFYSFSVLLHGDPGVKPGKGSKGKSCVLGGGV